MPNTDTKVSQLVINELTKAQFDRAVEEGQVSDTELYLVEDEGTLDYVVESKMPTEDDPSWYRVYKSGWVEQGGRYPSHSNNYGFTITLLKEMNDYNYSVFLSSDCQAEGTWVGNEVGRQTTTLYVWKGGGVSSSNAYTYWQVKGKGAN